MFTTTKRVFKFALDDFSRNKGRSVAAIFVLVVTIGLVTGLFFPHGVSNFIIEEIQNKIDITAYFKADTAESDILNAKDQVLKLAPGIKSIQYVSKDEALSNFTQKHQDNPIFFNALSQVGSNPFLASLNITTTGSALQYQQVADVLQSDQFSSLVDSVDYSQKKDTIDKVFSITTSINKFGVGLAIMLVLVVVLVVFNTIKLAIDSSKEEINTMRTVGATSWFVRAPFIIQGALFGFISFVICFLITVLLVSFFNSGLSVILPGFILGNYLMSNLFLVILLQLGFGVSLGALVSFIVVQKYLKV